MKKTVLLSAPYMLSFTDRFVPVLEDFGLEVILADVEERMEEEDILNYAGQFDGTICGDDRYSRRVIEACLPRLKVISKWGTGIDSIDKQSANELGVMVGNTPNAFTKPVSDSVMAYILSFSRRIPWMDKAMKAGEWKKIPGKTLGESTLGVIGVGNIGKEVIRKATPFGMRILATDIIDIDPEFVREFNVNMVSLEELLREADFITVNCDLNPTSRALINQHTLALVKPNAVLINTARGPIVQEAALVDALQSGRLAGAGMDVFEGEPIAGDNPLLKMDNVLLAPHNSNSSPRAWENVHWNTIRNLLLGLEMDVDALDPAKYPA